MLQLVFAIVLKYQLQNKQCIRKYFSCPLTIGILYCKARHYLIKSFFYIEVSVLFWRQFINFINRAVVEGFHTLFVFVCELLQWPALL